MFILSSIYKEREVKSDFRLQPCETALVPKGKGALVFHSLELEFWWTGLQTRLFIFIFLTPLWFENLLEVVHISQVQTPHPQPACVPANQARGVSRLP